MSTSSQPRLREELSALADTQSFSPDPAAWDRGRRARRRSQVARAAAAVTVVALVVGIAAIATRPELSQPQPVGQVPGGALPSRIDTAGVSFGTWPPRGRASVAYLSGGGFTLVDAEDGTSQLFGVDDLELALTRGSVLALSPDGWRLAWTATDRIAILDLATGEVTRFAHNGGRGAEVTTLGWRPDSRTLLWNGRDADGLTAAGLIDATGPSESTGPSGRYGSRGVMSPSGDSIALPSDGEVAAAPFLQVPEDLSGTRGERVGRPLPTDLYPDGAVVTPVGWADEDHVVAIVDPPPNDVTEHPRLAVFTSPDLAEAEWTWREFLPRLPPEESLSIAVDLVPDLTGDPDQELTHDFGDPDVAPDPSSRAQWLPLAGMGALVVVALLAAVALARTMRRRA